MSDQTKNVPDWLNREAVKNSPRIGLFSRVYNFVVVAVATFLVCVLIWNVVLAQVWSGRQQERQQWSSIRRELDDWASKIAKSGRQLDARWTTLQKVLDADRDVQTQMQTQMKSVNKLHKQLVESLDQFSNELTHQSGELVAAQEKSRKIVIASEQEKTSKLVAAEVAKNQSQVKLQNEINELRTSKSNMQPQHPMFMQVLNLIKQKELELENLDRESENGEVRIVQNQFYNPTTLPAKKVESEVKPQPALDLSELQTWSKETQNKCEKLRNELSALLKREQRLVTKSTATAKANNAAIHELDATLQQLESIAKTPLKEKANLQAKATQNELKPLLGPTTIAIMFLASCGLATVVNFSSRRRSTTAKRPETAQPLTIEEITRTLGSTPMGIFPVEQIETSEPVIEEIEAVPTRSPIFDVKKVCTVCEAIVGSTFLLTIVMMLANPYFNLVLRESPLIAWGRWMVGQ